MGFSIRAQNLCARKERMAEFGDATFRTLLEPFTLEGLYPEVKVEDGKGGWKSTRIIQPHQVLFHKAMAPCGQKAKFVVMAGGVGSGKSLAGSVEVVRGARAYPGILIKVVSAYDYYFDEFLLPTFRKVLPDDSPQIKRIYIKDRRYVFTNGSEVHFKAYDDPDKVKGWEAHWIWIEEPSELGDGNNDKAFAIYQALNQRLRCMKPAYPLRMIFTMNPKGHNWMWKVFIKNEPGVAVQSLGDRGKKTVFGYTQDNPPMERSYSEWEKRHVNGDIFYTISTNSQANAFIPPGYVASMLGTLADSPALKQRMVEGAFTPVNMLVYDVPIYSERTHLVDYDRFLDFWDVDEIPPWWRVIVGIDCGGTRSPWACEFYAQTEAGHWVAFDEIYALQTEGLMWKEIAELILSKTSRFESVEYWIDPISSQQKSGPTSDRIEDEFRNHGLRVKTPKGYNKTGGALRVQSLLKPDKSAPNPYQEDYLIEQGPQAGDYEIGLSQIYYLTNVPYKKSEKNPKGHACLGNIAEKTVFRWEENKRRQGKESEEGLSPSVSEKMVDRDDHAQTAEMFCFLGIKPVAKAITRSGRTNRIDIREEGMYGRGARHRGI